MKLHMYLPAFQLRLSNDIKLVVEAALSTAILFYIHHSLVT